jgi:hypothetical protein
MANGEFERFQRILTEIDRNVWRRDGFPQQHRPEIEALLPAFTIGRASGFRIHPDLKPKYAAKLRREFDKFHGVSEPAILVWYSSLERKIIVYKRALDSKDQVVEGRLWYAAACDNSLKKEEITPEQYAPQTAHGITNFLKDAFESKKRPDLDETTVWKIGFERILVANNLYIGDLLSSPGEAQQVYPLSHAIITGQIRARMGNINHFDRDAQTGNLTSLHQNLTDHSSFTRKLFDVLQIIDWRHLLTAFQTGDPERTGEILGLCAGSTEKGVSIYTELKNQLGYDQEQIDKKNRDFMIREFMYSPN